MRSESEMIEAMKQALKYTKQGALVPVDVPTTKLLVDALRAALAEEKNENTVQSTGGVHSRVSDGADRGVEAVTDCHDLEQARAVTISNLLAHFGITSANSDVNAVYLHKLLGDFLVAAIGCSKGGANLSPSLDSEECGYPNCLSTNGCQRQCPSFPRSQERYETSISAFDTATIKQNLIVEPVAHISGYKQGYCVIESIDRSVLLPVGMALYRSPPTSQESRQDEPVAWLDPWTQANVTTDYDAYGKHGIPLYTAPPKREPLTEEQRESIEHETYLSTISKGKPMGDYATALMRAIERAHGIGSEE